MISRFLIVFGDSSEMAGQHDSFVRRHSQFQVSFEGPGALILTDATTPVLVLPGSTGLIIGTLFPRHGPPRAIPADDRAEIERISIGGPTTLVERYWGSYVACFDLAGQRLALRDPSASQPCYYSKFAGGIALASDVDLLIEAGLVSADIDWSQIPRYLSAKDFPSVRTAIVGVSELLAGTAIIRGATGYITKRCWSPWDHMPQDDQASPTSEEVRRIVQSCTGALGSTTRKALTMLSGGLDSSVVAACLRSLGQNQACLTMVSGDGLGDEREYARSAAEAVGANLYEGHYDLCDIDLDHSVVDHFPKPIGAAHEAALFAAMIRQARAIDAEAIFTGNGGDNVFYNSSSVRPFFDRLREPGGWQHAGHTLRDIAQVTNVSSAAALHAILAFWPKSRDRYEWQRDLDFLSADAADAANKVVLDHAWLDAPRGTSPGKRGQVALMMRMQNHIEGYLRSSGLPIINPLTSQPIVELALGIPTWRQIEGGVNRAVVRAAFRDRLPEIILKRRSKGSPSSFAMSVLTHNAREVSDRLLDGPLAERGYLARGEIADALARGPGMGNDYLRLLGFLDLQAWIARWSAPSRAASGH